MKQKTKLTLNTLSEIKSRDYAVKIAFYLALISAEGVEGAGLQGLLGVRFAL